MKKLLFIFFSMMFLLPFNQLKAGISSTCTSPEGYTMLECVDDKTVGDTYLVYKAENASSATTATVAVDPTNASNKAILFANKDWGHYLQIQVTLPCDRTLNDYQAISFKVYCPAGMGNYQTLRVGINQNMFDVTNNGSNGLTSWTTLERAFPAGFSTYSGLNTFTLELGFRTSAKDYYIDEVMLKEKPGIDPCIIGDPEIRYTAILNPGTGTCAYANVKEAEEGAGVTLPTASPSAKCSVMGYTFAGWAGSVVSETDVEPDMLSAGFWAIPQDTTLYAVYTNDTVFNTSPSCSVSLNGTVTGGFLMVEDFENNDVDDLLTLVAPYSVNANSFAKVVVSPTNVEEQVMQAVTKNWDEYYSITVTLPDGKTLDDYEKLDYDLYYNSISGTDNGYKDFLIRFDAVPGQSSYFYKESTGDTGGHNTWVHRSIDLTGATGGNTFTLNMGIRGDNTNYMFDNIQLKEKPVTATYTVTFNPGAGTCATSSLTESAPSSGVTLPATATPSAQAVGAGWSFYGWSNVAVNSTTVAPSVFAPSSTYYPLVNVTLFAVYTNSTNYNTYPSTATSLNGTVTSRLLMVEDFETQVVGTALNIFNTGGTAPEGTAKISVSPSNLNERAVHFTTEYYNNILQLTVTLPEGKTIANYEQLLFDFYWPTEDYKKMNVYIDGVKIHEDENYISQAPINTWTTKTYNINTTSSNVVVLAFGISTDAGNYYMDNIKLKESFTTSVDAINEKLFSFEGNRIQLKEVGDIRVMDLNGRVLINSNNTKDLDLNMLNNGVYIVKAIVAGNSVVEKVMKR